MEANRICENHSGHEARLTSLEKENDAQWREIGKVNTKQDKILTRMNVILGGIAVALVLLLINLAFIPKAKAETQTINTLPSANSTFISDLQTFLEDELAQRSPRNTQVLSGGIGSTDVSLTHTISTIYAYVEGYYVTDASISHTYTASKDTYVLLRSNSSSTISITDATITYDGNFVFVEMGLSSTQPNAPAGTMMLFKTITDATSITTITDYRPGGIQYLSDPRFIDSGNGRLDAAVTLLSSLKTALIIDVNDIIADGVTVTIPSNMNLLIIPGIKIDGVSGGSTETLTINGHLDAGRYRIFSENLTVVFGSGYKGDVYPEWWGAEFDGSTTDTTAIQAAFNSGRRVKFPYGRTALTGQLTIPSGLVLDGNFSTLSRDITALVGDTDAADLDGSDGLDLLIATSAVSDVVIRNLKTDNHHSDDGSYYRAAIRFFDTVTDALIENVEFLDDYNGIKVSSNHAATRLTVHRCKMVGTYVADGGTVDLTTNCNCLCDFGNTAVDCTLSSCYAENVHILGIANQHNNTTVANERCIFVKNKAINTTNTALYLYGNNHIVLDNHVINAGKDGIKINSITADPSYLCTIDGNFVKGAGRIATDGAALIQVSGSDHSIIGNHCYLNDPTGYPNGESQLGIRIYGPRCSVVGNRIHGHHSNGDTVEQTAIVMVTQGSYIATDTEISGNSIYYCRYGISAASNKVRTTISGNLFQGVLQGIRCYGLQGAGVYIPIYWTITGNTFNGGDDDADLIWLYNVDRVSITGNTFTGTRDTDINTDNANGPAFLGSGNVTDGFATTSNVIPFGLPFTSTPTKGTWLVGDRVIEVDGDVHVCSTAGTFGTLSGITGSISSGSDSLTVNDAGELFTGCYITIAGVTGTKRITDVSGTTITIDSVSDATVSDAAVAYATPAF